MIDFYERQRVNRRRTWVLMLGFVALLGLIALALDVEINGLLLTDRGRPWITVVTLVVALGICRFAYTRSGHMVLRSLMATRLVADNHEHRRLFNVTKEMALAAGLPMPRLYVIPDPSPNALATGRDPQHAAIAVTQGALLLLDRDETQAVIAHEMAHIANRDTLLMGVVSVLLGGVVMLADWARRSLYVARHQRHRGSIIAALLVVLLVAFSPLISRLLAMAVSRQREYLADATAVQLTRNPLGLARALEKMRRVPSPLRGASRGTAHMFIVNPLRRRSDESRSRPADLFSTHPPIGHRIALLRGEAC